MHERRTASTQGNKSRCYTSATVTPSSLPPTAVGAPSAPSGSSHATSSRVIYAVACAAACIVLCLFALTSSSSPVPVATRPPRRRASAAKLRAARPPAATDDSSPIDRSVDEAATVPPLATAEPPATTTSTEEPTTTTSMTSSTTTTTTPVPRPPTWSPVTSGRIFCADIDPVQQRRGLVLFDHFNVTAFHACQLRYVWLLGHAGFSSESRSQSLLMFPPRPPSMRERRLHAAVLPNHSSDGGDAQHGATFPSFTPAMLGGAGGQRARLTRSGGDASASTDDDRRRLDESGFVPWKHKVFEFPITPFSTMFRTVVESQDEFALKREKRMSPGAHAADPLTPGATVLVPLHYCCRHNVHGLEVAGAVAQALDRWLQPPRHSGGRGGPRRCPRGEAQQCFRSVEQLLVLSASGFVAQSFNWHAYRAVLVGAYRRANHTTEDALRVPVAALSTRNLLYERLIVPGALYDVWPSQALGARFVTDLRYYFSYRRRFGLRAETTTTTVASTVADKNSTTVMKPRELVAGAVPLSSVQGARRKLAFMSRQSSVRAIVDRREFFTFLRKCSALVGADATELFAGRLDQDALFDELHDTRVMIGAHGADLGNMVFLPSDGAALIELNPVFFFEPRFQLLAKKLPNMSYHAWNCNDEKCAFGGDQVAFNFHLPHGLRFDADSGALSSIDDPKLRLAAGWPESGFIGDEKVCGRRCVSFIEKTALSSTFWRVYRSSDLRVLGSKKHVAAIAGVLFDAFKAQSWIEAEGRESFLTNCRV